MGTYIYAITKTEYNKALGERIGVLEYLYKPYGWWGTAQTDRWEESLRNKVNRRWKDKPLPSIVRWHSDYTHVNGEPVPQAFFLWHSKSPFWSDHNPMPTTRIYPRQLVSK